MLLYSGNTNILFISFIYVVVVLILNCYMYLGLVTPMIRANNHYLHHIIIYIYSSIKSTYL